MSVDLKGRNFLKIMDFSAEEIEYLLDLAADLKAKKKAGIPVDTLKGKNIALIFEKTSTRTRCAFDRKLLRSLQSMREYLFGTVLQMSHILHRYWQIF